MSISLDINCDECRKRLDVGDEVTCAECVEVLTETIDALEKEKVLLGEKIEELESESMKKEGA